jgi:hypothetical protein
VVMPPLTALLSDSIFHIIRNERPFLRPELLD